MACCRKYKKWDTVRLSRFRGQIEMDVIGRERSRQDDTHTHTHTDIYTYIIQHEIKHF